MYLHPYSYYWHLSHVIYDTHKWHGRKRALSFFARAVTSRPYFEKLYEFFHSCPPLADFMEKEPNFNEVLSRVFLYKNSTTGERLEAVTQHFTLLSGYVSDEVLHTLYYSDDGYVLWQSPDASLPITVRLCYDQGQRKEGFLSLYMYYDKTMVYHFNFRLAYNKNHEPAIYIGTLQGSREGLALSKPMTKQLYGYRPKGFLLYLLRLLTQTLGIHHLYAITDEGFYTNSHLLRGNRSKQTQLNPFWLESGAVPDAQERWYFRLPVEEKRRTYEEIKSQKRNLFRKRYFLMDTIAPVYVEAVKKLLREGIHPVPTCIDAALLPKPEHYDPIGAPC